MTLEQKIREADPEGNFIGMEFAFAELPDLTFKVLADYEGVLEVECTNEVDTYTKYLNGNNLYHSHEEAFNAEL